MFATVMLTGCIEDGVETSTASQPMFSNDSVNIGKVFTAQPTATSRLMVYNRHSKILNISRISLRSGASTFRLNVDGSAGREFRNIEIRPNDSIYILVDALLPENNSPELTSVTDHIDFETNGATTSVVVTAKGQDATRKYAELVNTDSRWNATYPYQIFDSLVIAEGVTLTLPAGSTLHFHDKAYLHVKGRLITEGTPSQPVTLTGDRMGNVVGDIPFDLIASQWDGVRFATGSFGNCLSHTIVKNTVNGIAIDAGAEAEFLNCKLRNAAGYALSGTEASIKLIGCEVADAGAGAMAADGGNIIANHCTFANYYLFAMPAGATAIIGKNAEVSHAQFDNCIFYGLGKDVEIAENPAGDILFRRCLFKSTGSDDSNFINCLWGSDPMFATVREDYIFDYRLQPGSPAIGTATPELTLPEAAVDMYGIPRGDTPAIGAYSAIR